MASIFTARRRTRESGRLAGAHPGVSSSQERTWWFASHFIDDRSGGGATRRHGTSIDREAAGRGGVFMHEWIVPLTDVVVCGLLLVLGGNLGSFLNVVVHRLPRGESVVHGGSHCPSCGSAIRWHDNVPVVGWLLLGGRCRDCHAMISARYPLVEAVAAIVIGGGAAATLLSGGRTLPGASFGGGRPGADNLLLRPDPLLIAAAILHGWLLFNLLLGAAVEADGQVVPARWSRVALGITLGVVVGWSALLPVGVGIDGPDWIGQGPGRGLVIAACGVACGALLGASSSPALRHGLMLTGAALGWQAVACAALLRPIVGVLRSLLASLIPPEPPVEPESLADEAAATVPDPFTGPIQSAGASGPEAAAGSTDSGSSLAGQPNGPSVAPPADDGRRGRFWGRLALPVLRHFQRESVPAADFFVATAVILLAWRWLWRGALALVG